MRRRASFETIDFDHVGDDFIVRALVKMAMRGCSVLAVGRSSSLNGFHVLVNCKCGACRMVWDDDMRFALDLCRPVYARNVLFQNRIRKAYLVLKKNGI